MLKIINASAMIYANALFTGVIFVWQFSITNTIT